MVLRSDCRGSCICFGNNVHSQGDMSTGAVSMNLEASLVDRLLLWWQISMEG